MIRKYDRSHSTHCSLFEAGGGAREGGMGTGQWLVPVTVSVLMFLRHLVVEDFPRTTPNGSTNKFRFFIASIQFS